MATAIAATVAAKMTMAVTAVARATKGDGNNSGNGGWRGNGNGFCNGCAEGNGVGDCGGGGGDDDGCRDGGGRGNSSVLAFSKLPLLLTNMMKYKPISQSHPCLVKMHFLGEQTCDGEGYLAN